MYDSTANAADLSFGQASTKKITLPIRYLVMLDTAQLSGLQCLPLPVHLFQCSGHPGWYENQHAVNEKMNKVHVLNIAHAELLSMKAEKSRTELTLTIPSLPASLEPPPKLAPDHLKAWIHIICKWLKFDQVYNKEWYWQGTVGGQGSPAWHDLAQCCSGLCSVAYVVWCM